MSARHTVLVSVPHNGNTNLSFVACDGNDNILWHRTLHIDDKKADVLIGLDKAKFRYDCVLYYGNTSDFLGAPTNGLVFNTKRTRNTSRSSLRDSSPVVATVRRMPGHAIPSSWEEMVYLNGAESIGSSSTIPCRDFQASNLYYDMRRRYGSSPSRGRYLVQLRSNVLCTESGTYRFALDCKDAGFLLVDGELTTSWPNEHESGAWHIGKGITLSAGVHEIEVWNLTAIPVRMDVGWIKPGSRATHSQHIQPDDIESIPRQNLITGFRPLTKSFEDIQRTLNPGFRYHMGSSYAFKGIPHVFIPVEFWNSSRNWLTDEMHCKWDFPNRNTISEGRKPRHVFIGTKIHPVQLSVTDSMGFSAQCEQAVDCRITRPEYHVLNASVSELPSTVYPGDMVAPTLDLDASMPKPIDITVQWTITYRSGTKQEHSRSLSLGNEPVRIPMVRTDARVLNSIEYRVKHLGADLHNNVIRFVSTPLRNPPKLAEGPYLFNKRGDIVVLVADENIGNVRQAELKRSHLRKPVLCIDNTLGAGRFEQKRHRFDDILERVSNGDRSHSTTYHSLSPWDNTPGSYGPNSKLAHIPALTESNRSVVVLSIGLPSILRQRDASEFEREIAALSDILLATKIPVIWVTPPPYSFDPVRVRKYAGAIVKVADARGMPVADVYSVFRLQTDDISLFENSSEFLLSSQGQKLVASCIAEKLVTREDDQ